jgi:uncharacterized protein (UPF0147 family)
MTKSFIQYLMEQNLSGSNNAIGGLIDNATKVLSTTSNLPNDIKKAALRAVSSLSDNLASCVDQASAIQYLQKLINPNITVPEARMILDAFASYTNDSGE